METIALVSVVMPVRNMHATVGIAIASILSQTYFHLELLVLDDGSTDQTVAVVRRFSDIDPRIRLIADSQRLGIAARLNQGIDLALGHYLARMDADDVALPNRIEKQIAYLTKYPAVDVVGTSVLLIDESNKIVGERIFPTTHDNLIARPIRGFLIAHPTWTGRIEWFRKWRYRSVPRSEDQDLLLRAFSESVYANLPDILFHYRIYAASNKKRWIARLGWMISYSDYLFSQKFIPFQFFLFSTKKYK